MEIQIFTPNLEILIQDSIMLIEYCNIIDIQLCSCITKRGKDFGNLELPGTP